MNIWYMNHYAGSPNEYRYGRPFYLSQALVDKNINCRVISASYHHLMRSEVAQDPALTSDIRDSINFTWVKTPKYVGNGVGRFKNMFAYALRLRFTNLVKKHDFEKPDVIIVSSAHPFHYFAGKYWAKRYKAKLIFEVRDIWPLSLTQLLGLSTWHPLALLLAWVEKRAYKNADQVVSLLANARSHMELKGLGKGKFSYIPNGISPTLQDSFQPPSHHDFLSNLKKNGAFIMMYTGAHGIPNALETLVKAAEIINQNNKNNIQFVLIGDGDSKESLMKYCEENKVENVHFLDPIPRNEIPNTLAFADMCFVGGRNLPIYEFGVSPNKLFEYMYASKPILMTIKSPNNPLELSKAGVCTGSNDPSIVAEEIVKYSNYSTDELETIGAKGMHYVENNHVFSILAQQYLDVIEKIAPPFLKKNNG